MEERKVNWKEELDLVHEKITKLDCFFEDYDDAMGDKCYKEAEEEYEELQEEQEYVLEKLSKEVI